MAHRTPVGQAEKSYLFGVTKTRNRSGDYITLMLNRYSYRFAEPAFSGSLGI